MDSTPRDSSVRGKNRPLVANAIDSVTQVGVMGGFLNSPPWLGSQRLRQFLFRGPATSLRLPLTHSELSLETIMNK